MLVGRPPAAKLPPGAAGRISESSFVNGPIDGASYRERQSTRQSFPAGLLKLQFIAAFDDGKSDASITRLSWNFSFFFGISGAFVSTTDQL